MGPLVAKFLAKLVAQIGAQLVVQMTAFGGQKHPPMKTRPQSTT